MFLDELVVPVEFELEVFWLLEEFSLILLEELDLVLLEWLSLMLVEELISSTLETLDAEVELISGATTVQPIKLKMDTIKKIKRIDNPKNLVFFIISPLLNNIQYNCTTN